MRELYENTIRYYKKILFMTVIVITIAELGFGLYMLGMGDFEVKQFFVYLWNQACIPFMLSIAVYIITAYIIESPDIESKKKNYSVFTSMALVLLFTACAHSTYIVLWGTFVFPVMLAAVFGYVKYMRVAAEEGVLGILVVFCVRAFYDNSQKTPIFSLFMQATIAILLVILSMFICGMIRNFVEINNNYLLSQMASQGDLKNKVSIDEMTGLFNHSSFYNHLEDQIKYVDKNDMKLSLAVVDIDNFKSVNDTYGHSRGDEVIIKLANILKTVCRSYIVCRYGGEEFAVIFPDCKHRDAAKLMEEALEDFRSIKFEWCDRPITFSCGVCQHYDIRVTAEEFFKQADKYLYQAKHEGKNRVVTEA